MISEQDTGAASGVRPLPRDLRFAGEHWTPVYHAEVYYAALKKGEGMYEMHTTVLFQYGSELWHKATDEIKAQAAEAGWRFVRVEVDGEQGTLVFEKSGAN